MSNSRHLDRAVPEKPGRKCLAEHAGSFLADECPLSCGDKVTSPRNDMECVDIPEVRNRTFCMPGDTLDIHFHHVRYRP